MDGRGNAKGRLGILFQKGAKLATFDVHEQRKHRMNSSDTDICKLLRLQWFVGIFCGKRQAGRWNRRFLGNRCSSDPSFHLLRRLQHARFRDRVGGVGLRLRTGWLPPCSWSRATRLERVRIFSD